MKITRSGANASVKGPANWFTGTVRIDPMSDAEAPGRAGVGHVTFEPGARTAWHTHPAGQTIVITFGRGRVQRDGGPVEEVSAGDAVFFPTEEKHWHGAAPDTAMSHIAITEAVDGSAVTWMEHVEDADYNG